MATLKVGIIFERLRQEIDAVIEKYAIDDVSVEFGFSVWQQDDLSDDAILMGKNSYNTKLSKQSFEQDFYDTNYKNLAEYLLEDVEEKNKWE